MNEKDFIDSYPETRQSSHRSISTSKQHSYADNFKSCVQKGCLFVYIAHYQVMNNTKVSNLIEFFYSKSTEYQRYLH